MTFITKLEQYHNSIHNNKWYGIFTTCVRLALAAGFFPSGMVKILGERFTDLANEHPMGAYLEALFHTSYYYPTIGVFQVLASILLLFPRTAIIGAFIYLPIILNITILSHAVRFDGSLFTSPLMTIAVLYLICWDYHKWKRILPIQSNYEPEFLPKVERSWAFPWKFALMVFAITFSVIILCVKGYAIYPRNSEEQCLKQCPNFENPEACEEFCACTHSGKSWNTCLKIVN